jgi:low affinity Fe/Cu permease
MAVPWFNRAAKGVSRFAGGATCFCLALGSVLTWAVTGPIFHYSETWQMVINTGTTFITFLMVFLIQNSQNRDTEAIQIKLDELIRATEGAHNALLGLEDLEPEELARFRTSYTLHATRAKDPADLAVSSHGVEEVSLAGLPRRDGESTAVAEGGRAARADDAKRS